MKQRRTKDYGLFHDLKRDWQTICSLHGKARVAHIWYYYKWHFVSVVFIIVAAVVAFNIIAEGQKPCRLRVCVVRSTANLTKDANGNVHPEDGIEGFFALELQGMRFADTYDTGEPLYAVIISNTEHLDDAALLLKRLMAD